MYKLVIANKTKHIVENKLLYYDIVNKEVNKGNAVLKLCKSHISISQYFCNFVTIMIIQINLLILTAKLPENNLGMKYN